MQLSFCASPRTTRTFGCRRIQSYQSEWTGPYLGSSFSHFLDFVPFVHSLHFFRGPVFSFTDPMQLHVFLATALPMSQGRQQLCVILGNFDPGGEYLK